MLKKGRRSASSYLLHVSKCRAIGHQQTWTSMFEDSQLFSSHAVQMHRAIGRPEIKRVSADAAVAAFAKVGWAVIKKTASQDKDKGPTESKSRRCGRDWFPAGWLVRWFAGSPVGGWRLNWGKLAHVGGGVAGVSPETAAA